MAIKAVLIWVLQTIEETILLSCSREPLWIWRPLSHPLGLSSMCESAKFNRILSIGSWDLYISVLSRNIYSSGVFVIYNWRLMCISYWVITVEKSAALHNSIAEYSEDPISGTILKLEEEFFLRDSYVNGTVLIDPKFTIPYDTQFISGILMWVGH